MYLLIFTLLSSIVFQSYAATISEVRGLSFGTIAITDNSAPYSIRMSFAGDINADPAFIIINPGHPAEYFLEGFLPNTNLNISILVPSETTELMGETDPGTSQFTINQHHSFAPIITTNLLGEATLEVGATLTTSGSGYYKDARFFAPMTIMVSY